MTNLNQLSNDLAESIAIELKKELKSVLLFEQNRDLKDSIKVVKIKDNYIIKMKDYWKQVEYLENPFVRFVLNTKMSDIIKKATRKMSR